LIKPELDLLDAKARDKRIMEVISLVRNLHQSEYLKVKRQERLEKDNEQKARETKRLQEIINFNQTIMKFQQLLGEDKKDPWLKNLCSKISGGSLCQSN
jgi:hypothetical protein